MALKEETMGNYRDYLEPSRDPMVDSWFLMSGPVPVVAILGAYLYFVLKSGPKLMENREPLNLKFILIGYNLYQVLFSAWLCSQALVVKSAFTYIFSSSCTNETPNKEFQAALANGAWWYFFSKVVELLDTVFFVLRKKQSQVTFLHVYHHTATCFFAWGYLKFYPGEQGAVIGLLNSAVHVVMYTYYFIAALGPRFQKYLWWKKYMTWIQLTQFCVMLAYLCSIIAMDCKLSKALTFFFVANATIYLYLFGNFYRKAYSKKKHVADNLKINKSQ